MEGAFMGFYADLSDLYEENVYILTLSIYSRVMESFSCDDKENELPEEILGRSVGDNFNRADKDCNRMNICFSDELPCNY
jgi:hypothetical protein